MRNTIRGLSMMGGLALGLACGGWPTPLDQACMFDDAACLELVREGLEDAETLPDGITLDAVRERAYTRCVDGGAAPYCYVHGRAMDWSVGAERAVAIETLDRACRAGFDDGCFQHARAHEVAGEGQDLPTAVGLYERDCEAGTAASCNNLAFMLERGQGTARDPDRATGLYDRSCAGGDPVACVNFGLMLRRGVGIAADPSRARTVFAKTCDADWAEACLQEALSLRNEQGGPVDPARAAARMARACELGSDRGCARAADDLIAGYGQPADPGAGVALLQKRCEGSSARACDDLGVLVDHGDAGLTEDDDRAAALFRRACDLGSGSGCSNLTFHTQEALHPPLLTRACELGSPSGCNKLGQLAQQEGDLSRALALYERACGKGNRFGCANGGLLLEDKDADAARALFRRGCDLGHPLSCSKGR